MMTLEQFIRNYTAVNEKTGCCRFLSAFYRDYPGKTLPQAYSEYAERINKFIALRKRVDEFERTLEARGLRATRSNISESRYYHINGVKIRFSAHMYPTGSMTNQLPNGCYLTIDLAAEPQLIEVAEKLLN